MYKPYHLDFKSLNKIFDLILNIKHSAIYLQNKKL